MVSLPISVVVSIVTGILTIGAVYGIISSKLTKLASDNDEQKQKVAALQRDLNIAEKEHIKLEGEVKVLKSNDEQSRDAMEELKSTVVKQDVFATRMTEQDKTLRRIDSRLDAGARTASAHMQATNLRPDPRVESDSDPPVPPMRPRLRTDRGTDR